MDVNLIKVDKIIDINKTRPVSFRQFSAAIISSSVSAAGFNLNVPTDRFSTIDWFMTLKLVNASKEDLIIENVQAEWIGKDNYRCKSEYVGICEAMQKDEKGEIRVIDQFTDEEKKLERRSIFLPILLKGQSRKFIRADFSLRTYKQIFFSYWKPISFRKEEIKEPETYEQLLQKAIIKIKINESRKPILLKI